MQFPLIDRLALLRDAMLNPKLDDAQRRILWMLLIERTNAETGLCYCSNQHIADQLSLDIRTIERAKRRLRENNLLTWSPGTNAGTASIYRFRYKVTPASTPGPSGRQRRDPPGVNAGTPPGTNAGRTNGKSTDFPKNDPATERRIAAGLAQLAGKLKSGNLDTEAVRAGNASLIPCTDHHSDAAQFKNWKSDFRKLGLIR